MLKLDYNLVFTIINLIFLYLLMKKFLFERVNNIIAKRQEEADKQLADASARQEEAESLKSHYETAMISIDQEKKDLLQEARKKADAEYHRIVNVATDEAAHIKQNASVEAEKNKDRIIQQAESQRTKILKQAEKAIADMVVDAAEKVAGERSGSGMNSSLYKEFIDKAGDDSDTGSN
jgi:F-type H+-transporting ATPase subunit b